MRKHKYLPCHTSIDDNLTKGKNYKVQSENPYEYEIIDDQGDEHFFTKEPDEEGLSYQTWFGEEIPE